MKIYLAGERDVDATDERALWIKYAKRRLFSYYYHGFKQLCASNQITYSRDELHLDMFLDSGAFTAFTQKEDLPLEAYAEYVRATYDTWTVCSSLDHIGQGEEAAQRSYDNFKALHALGALVAPVWHVREPDKWLARYIKEGHRYILIGGMVPETSRWLKERLDGVWAELLTNKAGEPMVKTHGFGLTDMDLMFRYPWHSVDSTSWLMSGMYGSVMFRVGQIADRPIIRKVEFSKGSGALRKAEGWHYFNLAKAEQVQVDKWLAPYKITPEQLSEHYLYRDAINAATYQGLEDLGAKVFRRQQATLF